MTRINILPPLVADMIAAGEVVERPASVIKELMENSFDAGASKVTVEFKSGGATYIKISDDGCGMSEDMVRAVCDPFTTTRKTRKVGLGLPLLKIPSGEITNLPYLEAMAALKTPVLLSTGMSSLDEITDALGVLDDGGCPEVTILHCNTQYPTPYEDANLTAMIELYEQFGLPVGLSDHTPGWECDVAAAVLGAQVIEKHFTLDKSLPGPDQKASLDPAEFKAMVEAVRHVEAALGDGHKHLTASEAPNKAIARKSIVAARQIKAGEVFTEENLTTKRPGDGISPMRWHEILGQTAKRDFAEDEKIEV